MTDPVADLDPALLRGLSENDLDERLRAFATAHGAAALPTLSRLAEAPSERAVRRAAKRALYRLSQRGVTPAAPPPPAPVVQRRTPRALRAWLSGIDGSGSRAVWILFEGAYGGGALCSLILNDVVGIIGGRGRRHHEAAARSRAGLAARSAEAPVGRGRARARGRPRERGARSSIASAGLRRPATFVRWQPFFADGAGPRAAAAAGRRPRAPRALAGAARAPRDGGLVPRPGDGPERCGRHPGGATRAGSWSPIRSRPSAQDVDSGARDRARVRRGGAAPLGAAARGDGAGSSARPTGPSAAAIASAPPRRRSPRAMRRRSIIRSRGPSPSARSSWRARWPPAGCAPPT